MDEGHELHDCEGEEEAMDLLLNEELEIKLEIENVELPGPSHVRNDENDDVVPPPAEAFNGDAPKMLNRSLFQSCETDFPELKADAKFLDEFEQFFLKYKEETNPAFAPTLLKFQRVYYTARKNLKRRMRKEPNTHQEEDEYFEGMRDIRQYFIIFYSH